MPLTDVVTEVSVWQYGRVNAMMASFNDSNFIGYLEELTGVRLVFVEPSPADAGSGFSLMVASGDFTDIVRIYSESMYPGGGDKAVDNGDFIRLNDLVAEYMPNYQALRDNDDKIAKATISDVGNMWALWTVSSPSEPPYQGLAVRKDLLDSYGMSLPVTMSDWENCLVAFRDNDVPAPLLLSSTGIMIDSEFLSAWDIGKEFYQVNGVVKYGYVQNEFLEYLTLMNRWYDEGLIYNNFYTLNNPGQIGSNNEASPMVNRGEAGAFITSKGYTADARYTLKQSELENIWIEPVNAPVLNNGDKIKFRFESPVNSSANCVTSKCKDPVLVAKLADYLYGAEGSLLLNFGKEGVSYDMVNGTPTFKDFIINDPNGYVARDVAGMYAWDGGLGLYVFSRFFITDNQNTLRAYDVWEKDSNEYNMPTVSMTADEGTEYSRLIGDITTYNEEAITSFIVGAKPLSDFNSYVQELYKMGIEDVISIQQAALDRYNSRG
ncbi:MAG: extracellular solute-binding protein [Oscillospiraceae bacterium]|nr:extracellular solute-binding protein [Oscillospiraceae bacterium]